MQTHKLRKTVGAMTSSIVMPPVPAERPCDPALTALRDHIATEALKSIISSPQYYESTKENDVEFAYKYADLMLEERKK